MHQHTLEPAKVDIKRTQTKKKTFRKYSIKFFTFFDLPHGCLVNGFSHISPHRSFFVVSFYMQLYTKFGLASLNCFLGGRSGNW